MNLHHIPFHYVVDRLDNAYVKESSISKYIKYIDNS